MLFLRPKLTSLNPFVQVFYSNIDIRGGKFHSVTNCLNPFVQVFYSNISDYWKSCKCRIVLIPLFRSFILIRVCTGKNSSGGDGLNPFVQVFYSNTTLFNLLLHEYLQLCFRTPRIKFYF